MVRTIFVVPRSPLAPSADGPTTPVRHRAVIAVTSGVLASAVGLVLLGIGSAAASTGPSPGPAAGPLPKIPATSVPDTVVVEIGAPPLLPQPPVQVAQAPPTLPPTTLPSTTLPSTTTVPATGSLPRTGIDPATALIPAWLVVITGTGLLAVRRRRPLPVRTSRRRPRRSSR